MVKKLKTGFTCGVFDLFHAGHVLMLQECKQHCDHLTVAINKAENINPRINPDKKPPIFSFGDRKLIMQSCRYVDRVVGYNSEQELIELLKAGDYNVRFLGEDYRGKPITGEELTDEVFYTDRSHGRSTSRFKELLNGKK
ncbi:adenylyltransferase/cytidyltransferase family protein [Halocola ammonii]